MTLAEVGRKMGIKDKQIAELAEMLCRKHAIRTAQHFLDAHPSISLAIELEFGEDMYTGLSLCECDNERGLLRMVEAVDAYRPAGMAGQDEVFLRTLRRHIPNIQIAAIKKIVAIVESYDWEQLIREIFSRRWSARAELRRQDTLQVDPDSLSSDHSDALDLSTEDIMSTLAKKQGMLADAESELIAQIDAQRAYRAHPEVFAGMQQEDSVKIIAMAWEAVGRHFETMDEMVQDSRFQLFLRVREDDRIIYYQRIHQYDRVAARVLTISQRGEKPKKPQNAANKPDEEEIDVYAHVQMSMF